MAWGVLLDDDRRTGRHWDVLVHPRLSLNISLLGVSSGVLVEDVLIRIITASHDWDTLYAAWILWVTAGDGIH